MRGEGRREKQERRRTTGRMSGKECRGVRVVLGIHVDTERMIELFI